MSGLRRTIERMNRRNAEKDALNAEYVAMVLTRTLEDMKLDPKGKVGEYVLEFYKPAFDSRTMTVEGTFGSDAVFAFLSHFAENEDFRP